MSILKFLVLSTVATIMAYILVVALIARFRRLPFIEAERSFRTSAVDAFLFSSVGDALSAPFAAIATLFTTLVRLSSMPFRLIASWIIRYIMSPLDSIVERAEIKLDERSEKDFYKINRNR